MSKMRKNLLEIGKRRVGYRVKTCEVKAFWNNTWGVTNPNSDWGAGVGVTEFCFLVWFRLWAVRGRDKGVSIRGIIHHGWKCFQTPCMLNLKF